MRFPRRGEKDRQKHACVTTGSERMVLAVTFGKRESENWQAAGQVVQLDHFKVERPRWVAIVLPGPWESADMLHPVAEALNGHGIGAIVLHLPGCQSSAPTALEYSDWIDLVQRLCERMQSDRHKLALLGVGLGGTLAYDAAARGAPIEALWMTAVGDPRRAPLRTRILGAAWPPWLTTLGMQWLSPVIGHRTWLPPGVAGRPLSLVAPRIDDAVDEPAPLPSHSLRWLGSYLTHAPAIEPEDFRRCPIVVVAPTADRWLQLEPTLDFYRRLPGDKQLHMLDGAGHLPIDATSADLLARGISAAAR